MNVLALKLLAAKLLVSRPASASLGLLLRHRIRNYDLVFETGHLAVTSEVEAQLFWRIYEGAEIRLVRTALAPTAAVIDLGSSLGFTASHAFRHLSSDGVLIAVEANESLLEALRQTLDAHADGRRVEVVHAAVDYSGAPTVTLSVGKTTVDSVVLLENQSGQRVPTITLGKLVAEYKLASFTLLADIEGAEAELIACDARTLAFCHQAVIELHDTASTTAERMLEQLKALGLHVVTRRGNVVALRRAPAGVNAS